MPGGDSISRSSTRIRPATSVPVTTRPAPVSVKARSTARRGYRSTSRCRGPSASRAARNASMPSPVIADTGSSGAAASAVFASNARTCAATSVDAPGCEVRLGQCHHAAIDAEQLQDLHVLARLRHHAIVERHHQQCRIDAAGAGEHRVHEPLMARHIDEAECVGIGVAEIDGDAAPLLLGQAIGIDAGQRLHQRGLAVIDVTGGADDHRVPAIPAIQRAYRRHASRPNPPRPPSSGSKRRRHDLFCHLRPFARPERASDAGLPCRAGLRPLDPFAEQCGPGIDVKRVEAGREAVDASPATRSSRPRAGRAALRFAQGGSAEGRCGTNKKPGSLRRHFHRHGRACPSHRSWHPAATDGRDKPGHDGKGGSATAGWCEFAMTGKSEQSAIHTVALWFRVD